MSILLQRVNSLLTEAEAIDQELIAGIFRSSLNDAIVEGKSINGSSSKTEINAAILILSDNISAAKNSMTIMNELFEIIEEVENFSENIKDGEEKELLTEITSEAIETYRSDDSTSDAIVSMTSELKSAFERCKLTAQPDDGKYFEYNSLIVNSRFET